MYQVERKQIKLNKNETNSPKTISEIEIVEMTSLLYSLVCQNKPVNC